MDFLAVDANQDKQVEHSAHYPTVANVEGAPLTGWSVDMCGGSNGELSLASAPSWLDAARIHKH